MGKEAPKARIKKILKKASVTKSGNLTASAIR